MRKGKYEDINLLEGAEAEDVEASTTSTGPFTGTAVTVAGSMPGGIE